ncbi:unnamed protein product [Durusdinium trenchii]|uniref:Uncharacterized protein n=1 Tax=Durusdinium trenchii TaxID=1381693 RepID=A0ABP0JZC0_9DINO
MYSMLSHGLVLLATTATCTIATIPFVPSEEIWRLQVGAQCRWNPLCPAHVETWRTRIPHLQRPSEACGALPGLPPQGIPVDSRYWWIPPCTSFSSLTNGAWCYDTASPGRLNEDDLCACLLDEETMESFGNWALTIQGCSPTAASKIQPSGLTTMHLGGMKGVPLSFLPPDQPPILN